MGDLVIFKAGQGPPRPLEADTEHWCNVVSVTWISRYITDLQ